ncbi:MAG: NUDIX domain-containing protein [Actinobacteria bacterium]|nr:NUDIX domain-containing protein [Actinomycetota bacterium]
MPRPAATVVAAREGSRGVEVLVLQRGSGSRFLPGYVVFPGGAIEPQDAQLAARWFGSSAETARACAVRELIEEAGLTLTAGGLAEGHGDDAVAAVTSAPPRADALREISRWIAPEDVPVRFDARFFAVAAPNGLDPHPDGAEAARAWWARPADVLEDFGAGRCDLYWPTMKTMEALAGCGSVDEVLSLHVPQVEDDE